MRTTRVCGAACAILAVLAVVFAAKPASADDQDVNANLQLVGFNNSDVVAGFKSSDSFDFSFHSCNVGTGSNCTASKGYGAPPKNIGNVLCLPPSILYSITSACQSLLSKGDDEGCKKNSARNECGTGRVTVAASCNWRTNKNKNPVNWNWTVSNNNGTLSVDCSNSNYQGYTD